MDAGEVTMKSLMDQEKTSMRYLIYAQRALTLLWAAAVELIGYFGLSMVGVNLDLNAMVLGMARARETIGFGIAGLLLGGKWWLVYGVRDFSGHETSITT